MALLPAVRHQCSHVLVVLTEPAPDTPRFDDWYLGRFRDAIVARTGVLGVRQYERSDVDLTSGTSSPLPFRHLTLIEVAVDGAEECEPLLEEIETLHIRSGVAPEVATGIYHPLGPKVGDDCPDAPYLTVAFANAVEGRDAEFREWYPTRHVRHALHIPVIRSGRTLLRSRHQRPSALVPEFQIIALYEQTGTAQDFVDALSRLDLSLFDFPAMGRPFAESAYRQLA